MRSLSIGAWILLGSHVASFAEDHWAWKPIARPGIPLGIRTEWDQSPVDSFLRAKLEAAGLGLAQEASREQLIRRVTLDLTGLPPGTVEIDAFLGDAAPGAWERVVDRLLASPSYGERWGRHWLDLARFAETNGFEQDEARPDAWRYRDYVIDAFNADKPYDRFVAEQLAGDELPASGPGALIATGFNLLGPDMTDASDAMQRRQNTLTDMTDTTALVFLGLTAGCAQCHDHKFEPILQSDYFRLLAFFTPSDFRADLSIASPEETRRHSELLGKYSELVRPIEAEIERIEAPYRSSLRDTKLRKLSDEAQSAHRAAEADRTPAQKGIVASTERLLSLSGDEVEKAMSQEDRETRKQLQGKMIGAASMKPSPLPVAMGLSDSPGPPRKTFIFERGEPGSPGEEVSPGFPSFLGAPAAPIGTSSAGRRLALARWITSRECSLTARVIANRLWQHHFGRGLVSTASDFGLRGEAPTHPELLDWLASELVDGGWSLKSLHRSILASAAYRQSSLPPAEALARDPGNRLFSRQNRCRLEGEAVRDVLLAASGRLNREMGGPGVFPPVPLEALQGVTGWKTSRDPADFVRRSVYIFARRNLRYPFLEAFDFPDSNLSCPKRERSTTAPQALALLNAPDVIDAARALAARLEAEAEKTRERVELAYRLTLGRLPSPLELRLSLELLESSPLSELCRALFNLNELVYVD